MTNIHVHVECLSRLGPATTTTGRSLRGHTKIGEAWQVHRDVYNDGARVLFVLCNPRSKLKAACAGRPAGLQEHGRMPGALSGQRMSARLQQGIIL